MPGNPPLKLAKPGLAFLNAQGWPSLEDHEGRHVPWHRKSTKKPERTSSWDLKYGNSNRLLIPEAKPVGAKRGAQGHEKGWPPGTVLRVRGRLAVVVMIHWLNCPVVEILGFMTANPITARGALWAAVAGATKLETLILGPSGTGKERIAQITYQAFCRAHGKGPLVALNAGALTPSLFSSELFGYERGSYTGADRSGPGAFRSANQGVLFLDEIGDAHENAQIALLRAIENQEVRPVGARNNQAIDVLTVAATNKPVTEEGEVQGLRQDLTHRLSGVCIEMPPLSHRREDIIPLAYHFLAQKSFNPYLSSESTLALLSHEWPGNIRELRRALQRAMVLSGSEKLSPESLLCAIKPLRKQDMKPEQETLKPIDLEILRIGELPKSERRNGWLRLGLSKSTYYRRLGRLKTPASDQLFLTRQSADNSHTYL